MIFSHDTEQSLLAIVDLVNTGPGRVDVEGLPDVGALETFVDEHEISGVGRLNDDDIDAVHRVRAEFDAAFGRTDTGLAAAHVNDLLRRSQVAPQLTDHDGHGWHIHYHPYGARLAEHLLVDGCMALAWVVIGQQFDRLRVCAAPDCDLVLVDLSRNRSKRYCDARTCGNRLHVAAYRERQRAHAG
jgi:predicted RNA-binding Zn ribbon-like protein